jgi:DNA-binding winged helix-turn-helix (wHTH) protein/tetratricopeptide (TPR) repeat protein
MKEDTPFNVGEWQVEPAKRQAIRGDEVVRIDPRNLRVLQILASHQGEVVSSREIEKIAWDGLIVTADSVYQSISQLRRTLGDMKSPPKYIETVPRRGYRLIAKVEMLGEGGPELSASSVTTSLGLVSDSPPVNVLSAQPPPSHESSAAAQRSISKQYWKPVAIAAGCAALAAAASFFLLRDRGEQPIAAAASAHRAFNPIDIEFEQTLAAAERDLSDSAYNATLITQLGDLEMQRGRPAEARKHYERGLAMRERIGGELHVSNGSALIGLARANLWLEESQAARAAALRAAETYQKLTPGLNPDLAASYGILAEVLISVGDYEEAEELVNESLRMTRQIYGEIHADTLSALGNVPYLRLGQNRLAEAEAAARHVLEVATQLRGPRESIVGFWHTGLAHVLIVRRKFDDAHEHARTALAILGESVKPAHPFMASANHMLAITLMNKGQIPEAERMFAAELQSLSDSGAVRWRVARASSALGEALLRQGRLKEAEPRLRFAATALAGSKGWPVVYLDQITQNRLREFYQMQSRGKPSFNAFADLVKHENCTTPPPESATCE